MVITDTGHRATLRNDVLEVFEKVENLLRRHRIIVFRLYERNLIVTLTSHGEALREMAVDIPGEMTKCLVLTREERITLYRLLYKLLDTSEEDKQQINSGEFRNTLEKPLQNIFFC